MGVCVVLVIAMGVTFVQMFQPHPTVAFSGEKLPLVPVKKTLNSKTGTTTAILPAVAALWRWTRSRVTM